MEEARVLFLDSIVVSISACHAEDRGSIPRRGDVLSGIITDITRYKSENVHGIIQKKTHVGRVRYVNEPIYICKLSLKVIIHAHYVNVYPAKFGTNLLWCS